MINQGILDAYGQIGVDKIKQSLDQVQATGKTKQSVRYVVTENRLKILGRAYFETIETGRGPRKSTQQGDFKNNMLEYMNVRGIGAGLTEKKKEQLAKFLVWKINKEGDLTFKKGGRSVYSPILIEFIQSLIKALKQDFVKNFKADILSVARA